MIDEIEVLSGLTAMLQMLDERQKLLQTVVDQSALVLGVPRVSAWLFDEYRTKLIAGARAGMPLHNTPDFQYRLGEGLIGWIAENVAAIRVSNAEDDPRFLPRSGRVEPLKAFLGVPLISSRRCIGVLCSVAPEAGHFSRHHEQLLSVVAGLCSQHLVRANNSGR